MHIYAGTENAGTERFRGDVGKAKMPPSAAKKSPSVTAVLLLEDGFELTGEGFGARGEAFGEVVFNTSISGYQEVLTDPSYRGQIVTMTYPLIGNYGIVPEDSESSGTWLSGFVAREVDRLRSNWRSTVDLDEWLAEKGVVGIQGIDTRALTRHLRMEGAKHGVISTTDLDRSSLRRKLAAAPRIVGVDLVKEVTCAAAYPWTEGLPGRTRSSLVGTSWSWTAASSGTSSGTSSRRATA